MDGGVARPLAEQFRGHFTGEHHLYWHLTRAMADDLDAGGVTAQVCAGWEHAAPEDVIQLRLLAGIFREVLRGDADELRPFYPCLGGTADPAGAWPVARTVMERSVDRLRESLAVAPQTNEVGRSSALLVGLTEAVRRSGMPRVRLLEPGASAGLNLLVDRFRFEGDGWAWGDPGSPVVIDGVAAQGFSPIEFDIVSRRGCDLHPIDAAPEEGALRLRSFVWPFQVGRHERLSGALDLARRHPVEVDRAGGADWVRERLAEPVADDVLTIVWQSVTRQYWPAEEVAELDRVIDEARARLPLSWVTMESPGKVGGFDRVTDHSSGRPVIEVDGEVIAGCDYHGPPIDLRPDRVRQ
jgi:hypothetical protein